MNCCDEYCSNYGCNQGRDCPIRVAKVGRKVHGPELLPPSVWREQLRLLAEWMLLGIVGLVWLAFLMACVAYLS